MRAGLLGLLILAAMAACAVNDADHGGGNDAGEQVRIYRDQYHTPHVVADSNRGVFYGYGYAVASDRLFQMEMLKRTAEGRVAEVLGGDYRDLDVFLRTSYDHRAVRRQLQKLPAAQLEILQAYADGFNARMQQVLADQDQSLPAEFAHYKFLPEPWTAHDVAMVFVGSIAHRYSDFNSERDNLQLLMHLERKHGKAVAWRIFSASKWLLDDDSPTTVPRSPRRAPVSLPARPAYLDQLKRAEKLARLVMDEQGQFIGLSRDRGLEKLHRQRLAGQGYSHHPEFIGASNYWAVQGLTDARAALVNGPQFGFSAPGYVYGIGLHGGDFNAVGNTLLALPALLFAHNNHIAWGSTAGISDQSDEFVLQLDRDNPERYRHRGGWRNFEAWEEVIRVKGADPVVVTARRSLHGMVLSYQADKGSALARGRAWEGFELETLMAWIFLATDKSLDAAHQRVASMATNINIYTMDRQGSLAYVHAGRYPRRAAGHDPRLPVPGSGEWDWQGLRPYADNPTVRNPSQGYIANWNNRPAEDWISSDLWTYTWGRADRGRILFDLVEAQGVDRVAAVRDINKTSSHADVSAPFMLPYLFRAWQGNNKSTMEADALALLQQWDGQWRVNSEAGFGPAPSLMEAWLRTLLQQVIADDVGEEYFHLYAATNYPHKKLGPSIPNPPGVKALLRNLDQLGRGAEPDFDFFNGGDHQAQIRRSFTIAVGELAREQGQDLQDWRLRAHPMQWRPFNYRGVPQALPDAGLSLPGYLNRGSENNLFVATGKDIEGRDVIPPGQSGFVSPTGVADAHSADQMQLYAEFGYKDIPFSLEQVKASAQVVETLPLPPATAVSR